MIRIGAGSLCGFDGNECLVWGENHLRKISILFLALIGLSGCAKVQHLDQLLTLKALADEQVVMGQYVEEQNQKFELMIEEVKAGTLDQYLNKKRILRTFGNPIHVKHINKNDQELESWLYRYSMQFFDSEKIYLYFDPDDNLVESEYIGKRNEQIR